MNRKLARLCASLVAVLALLGAVAAIAHATEPRITAMNTDTKKQEHAKLSATQVAEEEDFFQIEGEEFFVSCGKSSGSGTLAKEATKFTLEPSFKECFTGAILPTHIYAEGCFFTYGIGQELQADLFETQLEIDCEEEGEEIEIEVTNAAGTAAICRITIPHQIVGFGLVTDMTEVEPTDITNTGGFQKIAYKAKALGGFGCGGIPEEGTAEYTGNTTVTATNLAGKPIDLEVTMF